PPSQVRGSGRIVRHAAGRRWELSAHGFWQVHPAAADALAGLVADFAAAPPGGTAWDLYGGVGLFASALADQVGATGSVTVVDTSRRAAADGAAALADLAQVSFVTGRVERALAELPGQPDVVVLDPPRRGAGVPVTLLQSGHGPADIKRLDAPSLTRLAAEIRTFLVQKVSRTGGHLGPNLGAVELTLAVHRVFDSPHDPVLFDTGHQAYVHKIV